MPDTTNPYDSPSRSEAKPVPTPHAYRSEAPLGSDVVFWGVLTTQFLGAFNDNYFKQMVLLKCTDLATTAKADLQPLAMAAFALPFVLLSGLGGYISDRYSKRTVIIGCKVLEIVVMLAALQVLLVSGVTPKAQLQLLILVLAFMGAQSAIFGPAKYGVLPELFGAGKLLPVNGAIQMTTFMAIIFGMAGAGIALDRLDNSLWMCSVLAVGIAVVGTITSFAIRSTPVADPGLKLQRGNLFVPRDIRQLFRKDVRLLKAILVMMLFWFIGGVAQPAVNSLGENVLQLSKTRTSLMAASIGVGIAIGCVIAGFVNRGGKADGVRWTTRGSWMLVCSLLLITVLGSGLLGRPIPSKGVPESILQSLLHTDSVEWLFRTSMLLLGMSAGVFVVPIQVFIQEVPPAEQKGRLIGAMNFITWIGILISAGYLAIVNMILARFSPAGQSHQYQYLVFLSLAVVMVPVALLYRLPVVESNAVEGE